MYTQLYYTNTGQRIFGCENTKLIKLRHLNLKKSTECNKILYTFWAKVVKFGNIF